MRIAIILAAFLFTACTSDGRIRNEALGGAVGGATGAAIGSEIGGRKGAIIGGIIGAGGGYVLGRMKDKKDGRY